MRSFLVLLALAFIGCGKQQVHLIVHHATIYTVDSGFSIAEAMAIADGKVVAIGTNQEILSAYNADNMLDADEKPVYPGFNDAHAHFHGYATTLQNVDLSHTRSWEEVLEKTWKFAQSNPQGWLVGRGWDQNEWAAPLFPDKELLDSLFPNRPVLLRRIDGHAAVANRLALDIAEIHEGQEVPG